MCPQKPATHQSDRNSQAYSKQSTTPTFKSRECIPSLNAKSSNTYLSQLRARGRGSTLANILRAYVKRSVSVCGCMNLVFLKRATIHKTTTSGQASVANELDVIGHAKVIELPFSPSTFIPPFACLPSFPIQLSNLCQFSSITFPRLLHSPHPLPISPPIPSIHFIPTQRTRIGLFRGHARQTSECCH